MYFFYYKAAFMSSLKTLSEKWTSQKDLSFLVAFLTPEPLRISQETT